MLVVVDPDCGVCTVSSGLVKDVRNQITELGIEYHIVSFNPLARDFFIFAKFLEADSPAFQWTGEATVPVTLSLLPVPTHLLVDGKLRLRGIWTGGSFQPHIREVMSNQIVKESREIAGQVE